MERDDRRHLVTRNAVFPVKKETKTRWYVEPPIAGAAYSREWAYKTSGFIVRGAGPAQDFFVRWQKLRNKQRQAERDLQAEFRQQLQFLTVKYKAE